MSGTSVLESGEVRYVDLDSLLPTLPFPLSSLVEITGISPDFDAASTAIESDGRIPAGYIDLYQAAVRTSVQDRLQAKRNGNRKAGQLTIGQWVGEPDVQARLATPLEPFARRAAIINNLARYLVRGDQPWRDYQEETAQKTLRLLAQGRGEFIPLPSRPNTVLDRYGYSDLPTGSGKTAEMAFIADGAGVGQVVSPVYDRKIRMAVAGPTLNIVDQTIGDYVRGFAHFTPHLRVSRYDRGHKNLHSDWDVLATTYNSLDRLLRGGILRQLGVDILFLDEAHHAQGRKRRQLITASGIPIVIGFTATPDYNEKRLLSNVLPNKINEVSLLELINRGTLSGIHVLEFATRQRFEVTGTTADGNFLERDLEVLAQNKSRNEFTISIAKNFVEAGYQGAISCLPGSGCQHAKELAVELDGTWVGDGESRKKIRAEAIGDFLPPGARKKLLKSFEDGEIDVLTYVDYLNEGWDSDAIDFLVLTDPTASLRKSKQRVGRLARRKDGQPVKWAVELLDDNIGIGLVTVAKALGLMDGKSDFIVGDRAAKDFLNQLRDFSNRRRPEKLFPDFDDDLILRVHDAQLILLETIEFEAARETEMPKAGWPSLSYLRSLRPDLSRREMDSALENKVDLYDQRERCRSTKGNHLSWEIYFPPETEQLVLAFEVPPIAGTDMVPVSVGAERIGISLRKMERALRTLPPQGTIASAVPLRSKLSNKIVPHLLETDLPAIRAYADDEIAGPDMVALHSLAVILGRNDRIAKQQTSGLGLGIEEYAGPGGAPNAFVGAEAANAIVTEFPRLPDRPSKVYMTKTEVMTKYRMGKHTFEEICQSQGITPQRYMVDDDSEDGKPFAAACYSPAETAEILSHRPVRASGQQPPIVTRQAQPETVRPETVIANSAKANSEVTKILTSLLRTSNGRQHLPEMIRHFSAQNGEAADQKLGGAVLELLHAMSVLYENQLKQADIPGATRRDGQTGWVGPAALRLMFGSRNDAAAPRNVMSTLDAIQKNAAARRQTIRPDDVLMAIASELQRFLDKLSAGK